MTWLGTNLGKRIDLLNPDPREICIEDIITGLNAVPRFMGQTKTPYSVLQHSLGVASLVGPEYKLAALLHDATEAYIGDVPTPLKELLGDRYRGVEKRIADAIQIAFGCPHYLSDLPLAVKRADRLMLVTEHHLLQTVPADWGWDKEELRLPKLPIIFDPMYQFSLQVREAQEYHKVKSM